MLQSKSIFEFDYVWKPEFSDWKRIAEVQAFNSDSIREYFRNQKKSDLESEEIFFRRKHKRKSLNGSILVHDNNSVWKGSAIEISEGGAGIIMQNAMIVPGQSLYLHFKPGDGVPPFNAVCEVVSKSFTKGVKKRDSKVKYGLKFVNIVPGAKKAIKEYVNQKGKVS